MIKKVDKNESNDYLFPFTINKDINLYIPKDNKLSFQQTFAYLRKKLQIKPSRKTYIDSILKKCKVRFFKAINECLKQCLKINIKKIPQSFITNISIEKNKLMFELTVQELYKDISNINLKECIEENLCYEKKEKYFKFLCNSRISDLYLLYIQSKRYKREIQSIKNNLGIKKFLLYIFVSENYVNYYLFSKPHFCNVKNKKNDKNICYNFSFEESKNTANISFSDDKS